MSATTSDELVICIHGLWMNGLEMTPLRRRLQRLGYRTLGYRHATIFGDFEQSLVRLEQFVRSQEAAQVHLVAHSLGGLLARHLLARSPELCRGRVVTLGTPHQGSGVARALARHPRLARLLMGSSREPLAQLPPTLPIPCELGSIAGTRSLGMGLLLPGLASDNDGTVALDETQCPGQRDHFTLHQTHFGLLVSPRVAHQVGRFLQCGEFEHPALGHWRPDR